jgi:uncharacterized protein (DUF58 family)
LSAATGRDGRVATHRTNAYTSIAGLVLLAGVAVGRPEIAALALPFAALVGVGLVTSSGLDIDVTSMVEPTSVVEGEMVDLVLHLTSRAGVAWLDARWLVPPGLEASGPDRLAVALRPGEVVTVRVPVRARRWGAYRPLRVRLHAWDRFRLFERGVEVVHPTVLRVHPSTADLRRRLEPARLLGLTGAHRSRGRGQGIEYADTRPWVSGDRLGAVNWRVSARRPGWWVDDRHPERNAELVLFVDTFAAAATPDDGLDSTLDLAVDAAVALARSHLAVNDRMGVVGLGGVLRWVPAALGAAQLHRVVEAVLDSEVVFTEAEKGVEVIPTRALPPRAMVVALTPLLDDRVVRLVLDLHSRGFDLGVVECLPESFTSPGPRATDRLAWRLWLLEREEVRQALASAGVAVVPRARGESVAIAVDRLTRLRRAPRPIGWARR